MRRNEIVSAAERLLADLQATGVDEMFEAAADRLRQTQKSSEQEVLSFAVFQKLAVASSKYGDAEWSIAKILKLDALFSADTWQRLASAPELGPMFEIRRNIHFAKNDLPKILELLQQTHVREAKLGGHLPKELQGRTAITFVLPEDEREYSTPRRLVSALEAITDLYSVFCSLENAPESDLIVLACDSGSDKSFDFLGLAKVMEEVKKLVLAIWDRRVFYRHMHASQCISLIADSLPVIERIEDLKRRGAMEPEQAELLKRKTLHGATQFLESGIFIDEMSRESSHSPRALMRPEPKLLAAPTPTRAEDPNEATGSLAQQGPSGGSARGLTPEEEAVLKHLLSRANVDPSVHNEAKPKRPTKRRPKGEA